MVTKRRRRLLTESVVEKASPTTSQPGGCEKRDESKAGSSSYLSETDSDDAQNVGKGSIKKRGSEEESDTEDDSLRQENGEKSSKSNAGDEEEENKSSITTLKKKVKIKPTRRRILILAQPKPLPRQAIKDLKFEPFKVQHKALRYKASKRIDELAKPIIRKPAMIHEKDVFKVKKSSLKAKCSERIKQLAEARKVIQPEPVHRRNTFIFPLNNHNIRSTNVSKVGKNNDNFKTNENNRKSLLSMRRKRTLAGKTRKDDKGKIYSSNASSVSNDILNHGYVIDKPKTKNLK